MRNQLKVGALLSYATVAFNLLAGLLYTPWMVSCIGADDYGLYTLAISVINFFMMDFGLGNAVSRFLSKYYAEGCEEEANRFLGIAYRMYAAISCAIFVVLAVIYLFIDVIYANLGPDELATFKVLYAVVAAYSVVAFPFVSFDGILVSNEQFVGLNLSNLLQKVTTVGLIVAGLLLGAGVFALVAVNALTSLSFILVKFLIIKRKTSVAPRFGYRDRKLLKETVEFSGWVTLVQVFQRLIFSIMPSVIAAVSNSWEIALFGLASSLEGYVWTVANALNGMFMPKVSRVLAGGDSSEGLQELMVRMGRIQLCIVGLIFVAFLGVGQTFVECWMGEGYGALYPCALLLIVPSVLELPQLIANTAVLAANAVKWKALVFAFMAATNVALGAILSGAYGALGACASICAAYLLRTFGMDVVYSRQLGIRVLRFFRDTYARWVFPAAFSCAVGLALDRLVPVGGWPGFFVEAAVVVAVYAAAVWAFYLNGYEKGLVREVLGKLKGRRK